MNDPPGRHRVTGNKGGMLNVPISNDLSRGAERFIPDATADQTGAKSTDIRERGENERRIEQQELQFE
ncbi:MAG: hypothetical protein KDB01_23125 [Planctomycetaceae bacterium]|nr:hypothetical protein [Planctomycetaceae bacterium]